MSQVSVEARLHIFFQGILHFCPFNSYVTIKLVLL